MAVVTAITHQRKTLCSWEADSVSDRQNNFDDFRNQKADNLTHIYRSEVPVLRLMTSVQIITHKAASSRPISILLKTRRLGSIITIFHSSIQIKFNCILERFR